MSRFFFRESTTLHGCKKLNLLPERRTEQNILNIQVINNRFKRAAISLSMSTSEGGGPGANVSQTEVTAFVQGLLNQMQGRFNTLSTNIIEKIDDMGSRCV